MDYLSVSTLTKYLKMKLDRDPYLERVYLTGQVSNFRQRPTHQYFSLKDDHAVIQATMWAGQFKKLVFALEEGMKLNVVGRIQLYEPSGSYSIIIEKAEPDGIGALALRFEQLKKALSQEGLFNDQFKQPLPRFVKKIGVVTSPSGAVIQDIITTVKRRFAGVEILLYPTKVQGEGAAEDVAANIQRANQRDDLDVLIIGRGGGAIEDLWAFNEELVIRSIFESRIPIISSVGHETDTTLADFVADRRAATPTAAAELATPVTKLDLLNHLKQQEGRLGQALKQGLRIRQEALNKLTQSVIFRQPTRLYDAYLQRLDRLSSQLQQGMQLRYSQAQQGQQLLHQRLRGLGLPAHLQRLQAAIQQQDRLLRSHMANIYDNKLAQAEKLIDGLTLLDTSRIVARGYAILEKEGRVIDRVKDVNISDHLHIQMRDGYLEVEVKNAKQEKNI